LQFLRTHLTCIIQEPFLICISMYLNWRMCSLLMVKVLFCQAYGISVGIQHCP
jgi:hypothetical protein